MVACFLKQLVPVDSGGHPCLCTWCTRKHVHCSTCVRMCVLYVRTCVRVYIYICVCMCMCTCTCVVLHIGAGQWVLWWLAVGTMGAVVLWVSAVVSMSGVLSAVGAWVLHCGCYAVHCY